MEDDEEVEPVSVPLRGSGDESEQAGACHIDAKGFQSPCGEVVMKVTNIGAAADIGNGGVSVPLRGRGDESSQNALAGIGGIARFQSPCGEGVMKDCS